MEPVTRAATAAGELAREGRIMPGWPTADEIQRAVQGLGIYAVGLGPQLAKQIDRGERPDVYRTELPKAMLDLSGLLRRYQRGDGSYYLPQAKVAEDALREIHAKIQEPTIVRHVIDPARRELGQ